MKRSFGAGMGGGRGGGGRGMMRRALGRAISVKKGGSAQDGGVTRSPPPPTSAVKSLNTILSLSTSTSSSSPNNPVSANTSTVISPLPTWHYSSSNNTFYDSDIWDWESVDDGLEHQEQVEGVEEEEEGEGRYGVGDRYIFGPVPSMDEAQDAVSSLQHFLASASSSQLKGDGFSSSSEKDFEKQTSSPPGSVHTVSSYGSGLDWIEPSVYYDGQRMQGYGSSRVYDAFHLLQNEGSIQRAVLSLSTDKAVWDAVMNNDAVRELKDAYGAENSNVPAPDEGSAAKSVLSWIFDNTKAQLVELMDKVTKLLTELFRPSQTEDTTNRFQEKLRSSLLLSIVVLLIVVISRARRA